MREVAKRFLPPILWMGVIFLMSATSNVPGPKVNQVIWWDFLLKKMAHMIEYAILFYLWQRGLNGNKKPSYKNYLLAFIIVVGYAVTDEYHQSFTAGRHPRVYDVGYDALGAGLMFLKLRKWI